MGDGRPMRVAGGGVAVETRLLQPILGPSSLKKVCAILIFVQNWEFPVNDFQERLLCGRGASRPR